jgi:hypothetical protein
VPGAGEYELQCSRRADRARLKMRSAASCAIRGAGVGNCFLNKEDQPSSLKLDYKNMFDLD